MGRREITSHKINGMNDALKIEVVDAPGAGGANHRYDITGFDTNSNPSSIASDGYKAGFSRAIVLFQNGPLKENAPNGISNEALLAILIDRMSGFQSGEYKCRENALVLTKLEEAMHWLLHRTAARLARGVEGTSAK